MASGQNAAAEYDEDMSGAMLILRRRRLRKPLLLFGSPS